jgi:cyclic pyranopterin phosphate synthase
VITLSEIAGMQAAKRAAELIPLCHPRQLTHIDVKALVFNNGIEIKSLVKTMGQTGGDMEALTAVSVGLLTVYDLCRNTDKGLIINDLKLLRKTSTAI